MKKSKITRAAALFAALCMTLAASSCGENTNTAEDSDEAEIAAEEEAAETEEPSETTAPKTTKISIATTTSPKVTTTAETTTQEPLPALLTYEDYYNVNSDMVGWIKVAGTPIDYPCVQGTDNKYYLTHNLYKQEDKNGACFVDYLCEYTTRTRPANTIIYGHNMRTGPSFAKLTTYCPWYSSGYNRSGSGFSMAEYYTAPTITYDTVWEEGTYKVFAAMFVMSFLLMTSLLIIGVWL